MSAPSCSGDVYRGPCPPTFRPKKWPYVCPTRGRRRALYGRGEKMCDAELELFIAELEAIAPPCVNGAGRTDGHGAFVNVRGACAFCGQAAGKPHHPVEILAASLDYAEPWAVTS